MPSYILVRAVDGWNPGDPMVYMTGYMVDARSHSRIGGKQIPPNFCQVEITDDDDDQAIQEAYCREWRREIDYEFVTHNWTIDGHRIKVFVKPEFVSTSGLGSITRDMVETFLNRWNALVQSVAPNEVVFDASVYECVRSTGFWGRDVSLVGFTEISYDQGTGVHRIEANYGASELATLTEAVIEEWIASKGGVIIAHPTNQVTFDIGRDAVLDEFKKDVKEKIDGAYSRRSFKLLQADVDEAMANAGTLSITKQEFALRVYNRLDD